MLVLWWRPPRLLQLLVRLMVLLRPLRGTQAPGGVGVCWCGCVGVGVCMVCVRVRVRVCSLYVAEGQEVNAGGHPKWPSMQTPSCPLAATAPACHKCRRITQPRLRPKLTPSRGPRCSCWMAASR